MKILPIILASLMCAGCVPLSQGADGETPWTYENVDRIVENGYQTCLNSEQAQRIKENRHNLEPGELYEQWVHYEERCAKVREKDRQQYYAMVAYPWKRHFNVGGSGTQTIIGNIGGTSFSATTR